MKCQDCPYKKEIDAVEQLNGAHSWACTKPLSETEEVVCLLRMIIWQLYTMDEKEID